MFSGIIEEFATVVAINSDRENIDFTLTCSFVGELKIDQSVAHNGVCLTVVAIDGDTYTVTAMRETLERSNLGLLSVGDKVNVERSMLMNGRLDGHIVQGHVDQTARCTAMADADGSTYFTFEYPLDLEMARRGYFTVDKGSVTVMASASPSAVPQTTASRLPSYPIRSSTQTFATYIPVRLSTLSSTSSGSISPGCSSWAAAVRVSTLPLPYPMV